MKNQNKSIVGYLFSVCAVILSALSLFACGEPSAGPSGGITTPAEVVAVTIENYKSRYLVGQRFDETCLEVIATYDDGTSRSVTDYKLSVSTDPLKTTDTSVAVTYGGKTATRHISVVNTTDAKSDDTVKSEFKANKKTTSYNGYSINYVVREPDYAAKESDPAPLVLFLHGAGERGNDNEAQLKNSIAKAYKYAESMFYDSYVIAPQCPYRATEDGADLNDGSYMNINYTKWVNRNWTEGNYNLSDIIETKALAAVADLVEQYAAKPEVDASRVYVMGLSMGGYGTWNIIANHPELFAAAVPMCGGGPIDCAAELADIPIYAFHGTDDTAVPYNKCTLPLYNAIKAQNKGRMIFVPMQGEGHGIWDNVWNVGSATDTKYVTYEGVKPPRIIDWMFEQRIEA